jgi:dienelactone hydrolase
MTEAPAEAAHLSRPADACGTGVLVLAGSSGRVERQRADLLARHGALALSIRWFGGPGQRPAPHEVPLETFTEALDRMAPECDRLAVVGVSFGAEAALLTASYDSRVSAVVACSPTSVVWGGYAEGRWSSHWTRGGQPLVHVPFVEGWEPDSDPPAYRGLYERSLHADPARSAAAAIPVERIRGDVVLVAGGDDQVWPSLDFARRIERRRAGQGLNTTVVSHPDAGHRTTLPGESPPAAGQRMARGGTPEADATLGAAAWPTVRRVLRLR